MGGDHAIGTFARLTGLSVKALRNYDAEGLLKPAHVDPVNRHRLYAAEQVDAGRLIRALRDVDLPLVLIRHVLGDPSRLSEVLEAHQRDLEVRITREQLTLHRLVHLQSGGPMTTASDTDLEGQAKAWFNGVWDLLGAQGRTTVDDDRMVHMAHASRFAWGEVGGPEQWAIGDWQVARVYSTLGRAEPALHHACRCLEISQENGDDLPPWMHASAYEGLARAALVAGDVARAREAHAEAVRILDAAPADEDAAAIRSDLEGLVLPD